MNEVEHMKAQEAAEAGRALMEELMQFFDVTPSHDPKVDLHNVQRRLYKSTDCGAYLALGDGTLVIGSIVEGVDYGTEEHTLTMAEYLDMDEGDLAKYLDRTIRSVEEEAGSIWMETHGCEDCGDEDPETGYTPVDPECSTCGGHGVVI